ncbi:hypothetical protein ACFL1H_05485 [Nanoarchaeota archaeon]
MVLEKNTFLDDLKGNKEREIKVVKDTTYDNLYYNLLKLFKLEFKNSLDTFEGCFDLAVENLRDFDFDANDLKNFIYATAMNEFDFEEQRRLGGYTGILLHLLNCRYDNLSFYINGHGMEYDHLFHYAKTVDELIVDNFKGREICNGLGHVRGYVNTFMAVNCDVTSSFAHIPFIRSKAGSIIIVNNKIKDGVHSVGSVDTDVKNLIISNNSGFRVGYNNNVKELDNLFYLKCNNDEGEKYDGHISINIGKNRKMPKQIHEILDYFSHKRKYDYDEIMKVKQMVEELQ